MKKPSIYWHPPLSHTFAVYLPPKLFLVLCTPTDKSDKAKAQCQLPFQINDNLQCSFSSEYVLWWFVLVPNSFSDKRAVQICHQPIIIFHVEEFLTNHRYGTLFIQVIGRLNHILHLVARVFVYVTFCLNYFCLKGAVRTCTK